MEISKRPRWKCCETKIEALVTIQARLGTTCIHTCQSRVEALTMTSLAPRPHWPLLSFPLDDPPPEPREDRLPSTDPPPWPWVWPFKVFNFDVSLSKLLVTRVVRLSTEKPPFSCRVPSSICRAGLDPLRLGTFEDTDWQLEEVWEPRIKDVGSR